MTPGWVFCCPVRIWSPAALQSLFDITGDLDTPVSAFMKLAAFEPRFLLERGEGGERLARYSFIGFGDGLEVRLDGAGLGVGAQRHPAPASGAELLSGLRTALRLAPKPEPDIAGVPLAGGLVGYAAPTTAYTRSDYMAGVRRTQEYIAAGDVYQLVLASRFSGRHELDPFQAYRALRLINPSPYMYYCALGEVAVVGSSPEALAKLNGRRAQLRPIAGTRPRSADAATDRAREAQLLADPKENAEHVMLVDLARNDLGRVARAGSVRVEPYRSIERYSHVMHMVSGVHGELAAQRDAFDLFAAAFPAGTLVGAPKVRAMQIIDELEPVSRGLYGVTVGYFGAHGNMDHDITIRTLVFKGDEYSYQAGAGIVADSVPETEHEEVLAKSAALVRALELAGEGL